MNGKTAAVLFILLLAGCSMTPDYTRPATAIPDGWSVAQEESATEIARDWWTSFSSAELNDLMQQGLTRNNDLLAGLHRVEQSRAALKIAGADLLPQADASAGISRTRQDNDGSLSRTTGLNAGTGVAYELDLFGGNRAAVERARAGLAASEYDQDALALVVMGDVATGYFNILSGQERLRIADKNLSNARNVLRIVQARVEAGSESDLELSQQRSAVASSEAARAAIEQQISVSRNALAILLGRPPQALPVLSATLTALDAPSIQPGLPSTLLERRPDIRAAEMDLAAANADIGVARAAFFPRITLGLDWSVASSGLNDPATSALTLASSLAAPLFQGGRLEGGVEQATAVQAELAENYRKTVLVSFQEVEDSLAAVRAVRQRDDALLSAVEASRRSYDIARQRYDAGAIDFQTLLDTQNALLTAEDSHAQSKADGLIAAISLFKALGGGWR